jgi:gliding motility-associated-like protein
MKRIAEVSVMLVCLGGILYSTFTSAQAPNNERKYRVIAYKMGANEITSTSNETSVTPNMSIYVPNSFTPNGDGLNENFGAYSESVKSFTMEVYDRWGELIFQSSDINMRWDGKYKGQAAPQGSYVYKILAKSITGKQITKKGSVNLIM